MHLFQKFERRRECSVVLLVCVALVMTVGADMTVGRCHAMVRLMSPHFTPIEASQPAVLGREPYYCSLRREPQRRWPD